MIRPALATAVLASALLAQDAPRKKKHFFGLDKIWDVHLVLDAEAFQKLTPVRSRTRTRQRQPQQPRTQRSRYPYVKARITIAGHDVGEIGLRLKGASTYSYSAGTLKRSFKLDFDRHDKERTFLGLKKLSLNNNVTDPTQIREAVCYATYRAAGVPASRTAFTRVYLTVEGEHDKTYLGMYTAIEQFDRQLLKRWYDSKKGMILKPRTVMGYYGDEWGARYESSYGLKTEAVPEYTKPVVELAKIARGTDAAFAAGVDKWLDVEQFFRYLAVTVITANTDSPLNLSHNFYLVVPDDDRRVHWIPWDLNLSLNGWERAGYQQDELSLVSPSRMRFAQRVFDVGTNEDRYLEVCKELIEGVCSAEQILARVREARQATKAAIAAEKDRDPRVLDDGRNTRRRSDISRFGGELTLEDFLTRREKSVRDQIAGRSAGVAGGTSYSRGARATSREALSNPQEHIRQLLAGHGTPRLGSRLAVAAVQKLGGAVFAKWDADRSGTLDQAELAHALRPQGKDKPTSKYLSRRLARYARRIVRQVDIGGDGAVDGKEWAAAIAKHFAAWDRDKDGTMTRRELRGLGGTR